MTHERTAGLPGDALLRLAPKFRNAGKLKAVHVGGRKQRDRRVTCTSEMSGRGASQRAGGGVVGDVDWNSESDMCDKAAASALEARLSLPPARKAL